MSNLRLALGCCLAICLNPVVAEERRSSDLWGLYQEAMQADPSLLRSEAQLSSAEERERETMGRLLPQVAFNSNFNQTWRESPAANLEYQGDSHSLSLSQALYEPGAWRSYQKFNALTRQYGAQYQNSRDETAIKMVELYFAVLAAEDEVELVRAEMQVTERNLARVEALYQRQMATLTDRLNVAARADGLKVRLIDAENQVTRSRAAVAERVGREVHEPLSRLAEVTGLAVSPRTQEQWIEAALAHSPALAARQHGVSAAQAAVGEAKAGHLPSIGLSLSAQRSDIGFEGAAAPKTDTYVAAIGLSLPLYAGGSTRARVAATLAEQEVAEQDYELLRRQVIREIRATYQDVQSGLPRIKAARLAMQSETKSREAAERAFELGAMTAVDVVERVQQEFRSRRDFLKAQYGYLTSVLMLHRWSGRLDEADIRRANDLLAAGMAEATVHGN